MPPMMTRTHTLTALTLLTACLMTLVTAQPAAAKTYQVTTTNDSDGTCTAQEDLPPLAGSTCTLRQAINSANGNAGPDVITFNIPDLDLGYNGEWWTITLDYGVEGSPAGVTLPRLIDSGTTIDGFSQPGSLGTFSTSRPGVLDGMNPCTVLSFEMPNIAIDANKALTVAPSTPILDEVGDAMSIDGSASDITIKGMAIYNAALVPDTANGNAIAGYSGPGTDRVVDSMFIGVLPDGSDPGMFERNAGFGVQQRGNPGGELTVTGSYVGYNGLTGILGEANASVLTATFNEAFENGWGSESQDGMDVNGVFSTVRCNLSHDNVSLVSNGGGGAGLEIGSKSSNPGLDVNVTEYNSFYNNQSSGLSVRKGARGNLVQKNVIHDNLVGISVNIEARVPTNRNELSKNSTYRNMTLGIDLQAATTSEPWLLMPDGITPNDHCDVDGGDDGSPTNAASNDLQNYPDLTSADLIGGQIRVQGILNSTPGRTYVIQFFSTPAAETSGLDREGKHFIGEIFVTIVDPVTCSEPFDRTFTPADSVVGGDQITATATRVFDDPAGTPDWWSTSEYGGPVFANLLLPEGKVTGGGYIMPTALTACVAPCVSATDTRANFGFVAQYKNNTDFDPQGHLNFVWKPGNIHFRSTDYLFASLVVSRDPSTGNGKARWQGEGKLNNQAGYCFKANVTDLGEPGTSDSYRIKVWQNVDTGPGATSCSTESAPIYDNGSDVIETVLSGGNIQIHHP